MATYVLTKPSGEALGTLFYPEGQKYWQPPGARPLPIGHLSAFEMLNNFLEQYDQGKVTMRILGNQDVSK